MGTPLERAAAAAGDRCAVVCGAERFTYTELRARCARLAGALDRLGMRPGDRIAVVAKNCHRYLELYLAVPATGMVLVPLNARLADRELAHALRDSGARIVFGDRQGLDGLAGRVVSLRDEYEALLADAEPADLSRVADDGSLAGLFYTSGTTGGAKGVMLTHRNLVANARTWLAAWPIQSTTRWGLIAPVFHLAGTNAVLAVTWRAGTHVVVPEFDPGRVLDVIESERVTATLVVPTMLAALAEEQLTRPRDVSSLTHLSHGGSPIATETLRRAHDAFPGAQLMNIYGTTETSPNIAFLPHEERLLDDRRARSCGRAVPGVDVAVLDADGRPAACEEVGEIVVRGPVVMAGYWNKPEATAAALTDGWYRTGDLGRLDDEDYLYLVDRRKDLIVTGGENVYSTEVEDVLYRHPAVLEAAVFGIPDGRWGEAVHAVVVLRRPVDTAQLLEHCRSQIARFKVPKRVEVRAGGLPKSASGKILKAELRAPHWAGRSEQIAGA